MGPARTGGTSEYTHAQDENTGTTKLGPYPRTTELEPRNNEPEGPEKRFVKSELEPRNNEPEGPGERFVKSGVFDDKDDVGGTRRGDFVKSGIHGDDDNDDDVNRIRHGDFVEPGLDDDNDVDVRMPGEDSKNVFRLQRGVGQKYFVTTRINGKLVHCQVDCGAEISVCPARIARELGLKEEKFESNFKVEGFEGSTTPVDAVAAVNMNFKPGNLKTTVHVIDISSDIVILGTNIFREDDGNCSFDTKTGVLRVNEDILHSKPSVRASHLELMRREGPGRGSYKSEKKRMHRSMVMKVRSKQYLRPRTMNWIEAKVEGPISPSKVHSFFSLYNKPDDEILIPDLTFHKKQNVYKILVMNETKETIVLKENQILGNVVQHTRDGSAKNESDYDILDGVAVRKIIREEQNPETNERIPPDGKVRDTTADPVLMSNVEGKNKVDYDTLYRSQKNGIKIDMTQDKNPINDDDFWKLKVDVETERAKGEKSDMWPDKEKFLEQFKLGHLKEHEQEKVRKMLWDFNHVFFNVTKPDKFTGVRMKPLKFEAKHNVPKKDKLRRICDSKLPHLKEQLTTLVNQGVLTELTDFSNSWLSNVHIVLESRYIAAEQRRIIKSRLTVDYRMLNNDLIPMHFPLPEMNEFRRDLATGGFRIFSNLDAASFFYQLKLDEETGKRYTGFYVLNKLYRYRRLPMGVNNSPSLAQSTITKIFEDHAHAKPFVDDVTTYSRSMEEHLDIDLPLTLATCSTYNLLMSAKKSDLGVLETRVLGHDISEGVRGLTSEKKKKMQEMVFPEDKKQLISRLAFFSWFLDANPRLSEALGPLRDLGKANVKFRPTELHHKAFEKAKEILLDENMGRIRFPSADLDDEIFIFTDASQYSVAAVVAQMQFPTSKEVAAGEDATKKRLYIVQCFSKTLAPEKRFLPPFYKEFLALFHCVERYQYLLTARPFMVITDNQVVRHWANLEKVDDAMVRKIVFLQGFQFKIIFVETRLQPADIMTRLDGDEEKVDGIYRTRFLKGRIFNGSGKEIPLSSLFNKEISESLRTFFWKTKRTTQSAPSDETTKSDDKTTERAEMTSNATTDAKVRSIREAGSTARDPEARLRKTLDSWKFKIANSSERGGRVRNSRRLRTAPLRRKATWTNTPEAAHSFFAGKATTQDPSSREILECGHGADEVTKEMLARADCGLCEGCPLLFTEDLSTMAHCACLCARNLDYLRKQIWPVQISDENAEGGRTEVTADVITDDAIEDVGTPEFDDENRDKAKSMQDNCDVISKMKKILKGDLTFDKYSILLEPKEIQDFYRHKSLFRLNNQDILFRLWTHADGTVRFLLVVSSTAFEELLQRTHELRVEYTVTANRRRRVIGTADAAGTHAGVHRTLRTLGQHYYIHSMKRRVEEYIRQCAVCLANRHPRGMKDRPGLQSPMEPGITLSCDFAGPFANDPAHPYIFCAVDNCSRYAFVYPSKTASDKDVILHLNEIRKEWAGFPRRIQMDRALCKSNTLSSQMLRQHGIELFHGMACVSRCQSKVERFIGSFVRLLLKLHDAASEKLPFSSLIDEARVCYNTTATDTLGGRSPADLHFTRSNANLIDDEGLPVGGIPNLRKKWIPLWQSRVQAFDDVIKNDVRRFQQRRERENPLDFTSHLQIGDLCFKKRTSFLQHTPKKIQHRVDNDAYEIVAKLATNSFRCLSLRFGNYAILPGDHLIRTHLSREGVLKILDKIETLRCKTNGSENDAAITRSRARRPQRIAPIRIDAVFRKDFASRPAQK